MKKIMLQTILFCCLCMASCSDSEGNEPILPPDQEQEEPVTPDRPQDYAVLINKTTPAPSSYGQEAEHRGEVVRIDYDTRDYAEGTGAARTNAAYVYLPYGYDQHTDRRYNVLYFVHGHYGTAATTFEAENGLLRKLLDHMTENGDMAPTIVVSPSYNYGQPTANYADADPYCEALPQELVNDLIPIVESRYRTYAESTNAAGLEASHGHRAIGGFSMGAVTTWYALEHTLSCFKYFMPVSADCWSLGRFAGMNRPTKRHAIWRISLAGRLTPAMGFIFGRRAERTIRPIGRHWFRSKRWQGLRMCFSSPISLSTRKRAHGTNTGLWRSTFIMRCRFSFRTNRMTI
ncbi:alpha/beta hydrolase [Alistipes putredinis]|uniref:alpha/beta hydrolase n=1 Tax=Alistipes putredinis TaxID=28117 RepID=UPI003AAD5CBE